MDDRVLAGKKLHSLENRASGDHTELLEIKICMLIWRGKQISKVVVSMKSTALRFEKVSKQSTLPLQIRLLPLGKLSELISMHAHDSLELLVIQVGLQFKGVNSVWERFFLKF